MLKEKVIVTSITTRTQYNATTWDTTTDKLFFLSEADLFGKINGTETANVKDYTYGNKVLVPNVNMRKFIGSTTYAWLRSPKNFIDHIAGVYYSSGVNDASRYYSKRGVRPALWVQMPPQ